MHEWWAMRKGMLRVVPFIVARPTFPIFVNAAEASASEEAIWKRRGQVGAGKDEQRVICCR